MHSPESYSAPYLDQGTKVANFFGMIANIDENVGKMRDFLEQEGLVENTIFIFTTDNGTSTGEGVHNAGMRGKKGSEYDGGHRVPFLIYWPAGGLAGGRDVDPVTAHVDVLPTLIDLCGIPAPEDVKFDGQSIRPLLEGSEGNWPDRLLITDSQRVKDPIKWRKSSVMSSQWRLINGTELYDIDADPGQESDVALQNPEVVERLKGFYEAWWTELEPTFKQDCAIFLGHPSENPARLTSHDWITTGSTPWNQGGIRNAQNGPEVTGFWNVKVVESGEYEIRLRRWPEESGAVIDAELEPGPDVPGDQAFRARPGKAIPVVRATLQIGDQVAELPVNPGDLEVVFKMQLNAETTRMTARFYTSDDEEFGAYYAYVKRL
jgi:arylsulfatase B